MDPRSAGRAILRDVGVGAIERSSSLLRLLAAAFGREEPSRLRLAVREIGLGPDIDPGRVRVLARELAAWDSVRKPPDQLAEVLRLTTTGDAEPVWLSALSGLGQQAGRQLERLWQFERPPEPVRETIRTLDVGGVPGAV